jgi:hypothetical protein
MLRFAPLLLLLIAVPASGTDMASVEAIINSCQKGQICSCPRAKIARIDKSACGPEPEWISDANSLVIDGHGNAKKFDKYNKCLDELFDANIKIDKYNDIFERCQHPEASDGKTRFTNLPARPSYSGDGKTLNEQVQDVKAAERAQEQALREQEAARQAEQDRAYAAAHPSAAPQQQQPAGLMTDDGRHIIQCLRGIGGNPNHLVCLTVEPSTQSADNTTVNGLQAGVTGNQIIYGNLTRPYAGALRPYP